MIRPLASLLIFLLLVSATNAKDVYVDNVAGKDTNDGSLPITADISAGPVLTFERAARLADCGDVIVLKNNGIPYYDSLSLTGPRHSGTPRHRFIVEGNGVTISGLRSVLPEGWREVIPQVWRLTLTRKGDCLLLRDGKPLPQLIAPADSNPLTTLPAGQWVNWKGSLYFRQDSYESPDQQMFSYTADQTGISLHKVSHVVIRNLKLEHFRFDGLHAQGICDHVELANVVSIENGRSGVASSGGSHIELFGSEVARNGRHQMLSIGRSTAIERKIE